MLEALIFSEEHDSYPPTLDCAEQEALHQYLEMTNQQAEGGKEIKTSQISPSVFTLYSTAF